MCLGGKRSVQRVKSWSGDRMKRFLFFKLKTCIFKQQPILYVHPLVYSIGALNFGKMHVMCLTFYQVPITDAKSNYYITGHSAFLWPQSCRRHSILSESDRQANQVALSYRTPCIGKYNYQIPMSMEGVCVYHYQFLSFQIVHQTKTMWNGIQVV